MRKKKRRTGVKISNSERKILWFLRDNAAKDQNFRCYWCRCAIFPAVGRKAQPNAITGDHLIPLKDGGKTIKENVVAACLRCNTSRNTGEGNAEELYIFEVDVFIYYLFRRWDLLCETQREV